MFARRLALLAPALTLVAMAACSEDDDDHPAPFGRGGASGSSASGGSAGRSGGGAAGRDGGAATGGTAGQAGDGAAGASGDGGDPDAGPSVCGNGVVERGEGCDGTDLREQECTSYGFERGVLACENCRLDFSGCSGTENCADGRDNDGDQAVDCADADCRASCENACSAPLPLPDPALGIEGQTNGHSSQLVTSCLLPGTGSGPETVYSFTAARTGVLDVRLTSLLVDLNLSVRTSCADGASEIGCSERIAGNDATEDLTLPINQGQTVFIVVDGSGAVEGRYALQVASRTITCGDSFRDIGEECDDGNLKSGDGCSADCRLEPDEAEPNGTTGQATPYSGYPFVAAIGAPGDVDVFSIPVARANSTITAETFDMGDGTCAGRVLDSSVEILAPDGTTVLASDDDSGPGLCSVATATGVGAGTHFVRVRVSGIATAFPYRLNIVVSDR